MIQVREVINKDEKSFLTAKILTDLQSCLEFMKPTEHILMTL